MEKSAIDVKAIAIEVEKEKALRVASEKELEKTAAMILTLGRRLFKYQHLPASKRERFQEVTDLCFFGLFQALRGIGCNEEEINERFYLKAGIPSRKPSSRREESASVPTEK